MMLRFEIVLEEDDGRYYAHCPALEGLHVDGQTLEEACENAKQAIIAYLESMRKHNDPIPVGCIVRERHRPRMRDVIRGWIGHRPQPRIKELLIPA